MGVMQGSGNEEDPYFFNDLNSIPTHLKLIGLKSHLLVDGGLFEDITITRCRNVKLRNSKIITITLNESINILIEDCVFKVLNIKRSRGNTYRNNTCSLAVKNVFEKKHRIFPVGDLIEIMMHIAVVGMFTFIFFLSTITFNPFLFMFFFILGIFIYGMYYFLFRQKVRTLRSYFLMRKKRDILENNQFSTTSNH